MKSFNLFAMLMLAGKLCSGDTYVDGSLVSSNSNGLAYTQRIISTVTNGFTVSTNLANVLVNVLGVDITCYKTGTNAFGNIYKRGTDTVVSNSSAAVSTWQIQFKYGGFAWYAWTNCNVSNNIIDTYSFATIGSPPGPEFNTSYLTYCLPDTVYLTNWSTSIVTNWVTVKPSGTLFMVF